MEKDPARARAAVARAKELLHARRDAKAAKTKAMKKTKAKTKGKAMKRSSCNPKSGPRGAGPKGGGGGAKRRSKAT